MTTQTIAPSDTQTVSSISAVLPEKATASLREQVKAYLRHYLIDSPASTDLYTFILGEIEIPLLEMTLHYYHQNQVKTAQCLGISRGTLRKKMQQYGLLKNPIKISK